MAIERAEIGEEGCCDGFQYVKQWQQTRKDMIKCAGDLLKRSEETKNNPALAEKLKKRSMNIYNEVLRMEKRAKPGLSAQQLRFDALKAWFVMYKNK